MQDEHRNYSIMSTGPSDGSHILDQKPPIIVSVVGPPGSGKSTLLPILARQALASIKGLDSVLVVREPINVLRELDVCDTFPPVDPINLFQLFMEDPETYAARFQLMMHAVRADLHTEVRTKALQQGIELIITDRSMLDDRLFWRAHRKMGNISDVDQSIYDFMVQSRVELNPDIHVFVDVSVDTALERVGQRGEAEEDGFPVGLMQCLHEMHQEQYAESGNLCGTLRPARVVHIDGEQNMFDMDDDDRREWLDETVHAIRARLASR